VSCTAPANRHHHPDLTAVTCPCLRSASSAEPATALDGSRDAAAERVGETRRASGDGAPAAKRLRQPDPGTDSTAQPVPPAATCGAQRDKRVAMLGLLGRMAQRHALSPQRSAPLLQHPFAGRLDKIVSQVDGARRADAPPADLGGASSPGGAPRTAEPPACTRALHSAHRALRSALYSQYTSITQGKCAASSGPTATPS
jgi:hypothetical protein